MSEAMDTMDQKMPAKSASFADSGSDTDDHHHNPHNNNSNLHHEHPKAAKPALKKNRTQRESEKKHLKFDEETIAEHDKLRGTRQTIDEPNTPYAQYDSGAESDGSARPKSPANQKPSVDWDLLQTRLDSVAAVQTAYPSSPSASSCQADEDNVEPLDDRKKEMKQLEFKEHRKRHYNEMELVRRFRMHNTDDVVVDDNGDHNNNQHDYGDNGRDEYDGNDDADNEQEDDDDEDEE